MADVNAKVTQIRQAVLGKDVRESIAQGIEAINTQVETTTASEAGRVSAEQSRVTAETSRVNAENSRVTAESGRQTTFTNNEAARGTTFNNNETTRQNTFNTGETNRQTTFTTNENGRIAAETSRVNAENSRVSEFAQIKSDYNTASNFNVVTYDDWVYTASKDTNTFEIEMGIFNPVLDIPELSQGGIILNENDQYTRIGAEITLTYTLLAGEKINVRVFKGVINTPPQSDGSNMMDGSITKIKFSADVQDKLTKSVKAVDFTNETVTVNNDIHPLVKAELNEIHSEINEIIYNVKNPILPRSAAVGDGVADDSVAIQAGIDYVANLGGGKVYIPVGTYRTTVPIILRQYVELVGCSEYSSIIQKDGNGVVSNHNFDSIIAIEDLSPSYAYGVKIKSLKIKGLSNNAYGVKLGNATHLVMKDLLINEVQTGVSGNDVWLSLYENIVCRNVVSGTIGFNITMGTTNNFIRCWSKNFKAGYNLGTVNYCALHSCGCDTFTDYAYNGGSAVTYNGCGAESGILISGGYVFGNGAREVVINGCQCLNISTDQSAGLSSLFYFNGTRAKITGFRLSSFNNDGLIDLIKTDGDAKVNIENSVLPTNFYRKTNQSSDYSGVSIRDGEVSSHYFKDATKQYAYRSNDYTSGYKLSTDKEAIGKSVAESPVPFKATNNIHKNTHIGYSGSAAVVIPIVQISSETVGNYNASFHLKVIVNSATDSAMYEGYGTIVNGTKNAITLTNKYGSAFTVSAAWNGSNLEFTLGSTYSMVVIETKIVQRESSGNIKMLWL